MRYLINLAVVVTAPLRGHHLTGRVELDDVLLIGRMSSRDGVIRKIRTADSAVAANLVINLETVNTAAGNLTVHPPVHERV